MTDLIATLQAVAGNVETAVEPVGIDFDGTNDYLSRSSDLTGNADGKTFTFSAWVWKNAALSRVIYVSDNGSSNEGVRIDVVSNGSFQVQAWNASASRVVYAEGSAVIPIRTWTHVIVSVDLSATTFAMYVNDEAVSLSPTLTNDNIDFTKANHAIARNRSYSGADEYDGRLAGVYLDYTYRDLSVEANRRDFIDADGLYVTPPTSGIISVPMDDPDDPGRNDGTGGDFTLNGVVAQSGRGPNQYNAAASTFDGSADYLSKSNLLQGRDGRYCTCSFFLNPNTQTTVTDYGSSFSVQHDFNKKINIRYSPNNDVLDSVVTSNAFPYNKWIHVCFSFDSQDAQNTFQLFVDGVQQTVSGNFTNRTSNTFGSDTFNVAKYAAANNKDISDFWFTLGTAIDLSSDNPFYDTETDKPKYLGASGELPTGSSPLIYMPLRADDAGNNLGTGGDLTVNSGPYTGARGPSEYWASAAEFNGSNQYLRLNSLSGVSNSKVFTFACSVYLNGTASEHIFSKDPTSSSTYGRFRFNVSGSSLFIQVRDSSDTMQINLGISNSMYTSQWLNILVCFDSSSQSNCKVFVNGVDKTITFNTFTTDYTIPFSSELNITKIGANKGVTSTDGYFDGKIGNLWFDDSYVDLSQEANRLKFLDGLNNPVNLGEDGSTPTEAQPLIYLNEGFHLGTNLGSGGNFTPQNSPTDGGYVNG